MQGAANGNKSPLSSLNRQSILRWGSICVNAFAREPGKWESLGWSYVDFFFRALFALDYFNVWSVLVCEVLWWPIVCGPMGRTGAGTAQLPKPELPPRSNIICLLLLFKGTSLPYESFYQCIQDKKKYNGVIPDITPPLNEIAHCNRTLTYMSRWTLVAQPTSRSII